jgi:phenylacetate-coenzyme A ligase PaaK-like adenylate-forming protein
MPSRHAATPSAAGRPVYDPWRTAAAYADALAVSAAPERVWRSRQAARLEALLDDVLPRSPLYRACWQDRPALAPHERLALVPPIPRRTLVRRFDAWVTDPALTRAALCEFVHDRDRRGAAFAGRDGQYQVCESSGSSGEPALFAHDARALAVADALEAARGPLTLPGAGTLPGLPEMWRAGARVALVAATDGHYASVIALERLRALNPWLAATLRSFSFLQPLADLSRALEAFAPDVLASYPSMAWVLAEEQAAGRLRLKLATVCTGGETLTPATRRRLSEVFAAPVHDSYGASECLFIASPCRAARLHLNADWVILEPVDGRGHAVPEGEVGRTTLLTNLANAVQPVVRYDLGDRVRCVPGRCACGSSLPVIEVQGRADDVLSLRDAAGRSVHLAPLALTTVLEEQGGVFDFVLSAVGPQSLRLALFAPGADARRAGGALRAHLRSAGLGNVRLVVKSDVHAPPRGRSGKRQRVVASPRR